MSTVRWVSAVVICAVAGSWLLNGWASAILALPPAPDSPPTRPVRLVGRTVATRDGVVRTKRRGRLLAVAAKVGQRVEAGEELFTFEDLGLQESRADLEREISELRERAEEVAASVPRSDSQAVRLAALQHLGQTVERGRKDLERWQELYDEGLLARVEFEAKKLEFDALEKRLAAARAEAAKPRPAVSDRTDPPALRRAQRLLARVESLSDSFSVASPWDGSVSAIHVEVGDSPTRNAPLATVVRDALPNVEAFTDGTRSIVAVIEACGVPGPLPFSVQEETLRLLAPLPSLLPGDSCPVTVSARK